MDANITKHTFIQAAPNPRRLSRVWRGGEQTTKPEKRRAAISDLEMLEDQPGNLSACEHHPASRLVPLTKQNDMCLEFAANNLTVSLRAEYSTLNAVRTPSHHI